LAGCKQPELDWRRQYLLCRIQLADGVPVNRLAGRDQLMALAPATGQSVALAASANAPGGDF